MAEELKERKSFEAHMRVGGHSNHDKHPDGSYVSSAMELWWQGLKALGQLPSQGGEAVEVVASIAVDAEGVVRDFTLEPGLDRHPGGYTVTPLMTVAQHQRILAASASKTGEAVATDAFVPGSLADLLFQLGEKGIQVSGGTHGDHWKVAPLYTHPADQVAQPDAELVACLKFARTTMAVVADNANLRGVEYRSLIAEIKRIDAKLASLKGVEE